MLAFTHGNEKGTGSRLEVDISPATEDNEGRVVIRLRPQSNMKERGEWQGPKFATFDKIELELGVGHVAHILRVLDGTTQSLLGTKGLRLKLYDTTLALHFDKVATPYDGFAVHMQSWDEKGVKRDERIVLNETEGAALRDVLRSSMGRIAFG